MTEHSSRPAADAADETQSRNLALDQAESGPLATDVAAATEAGITAGSPAMPIVEPNAEPEPAAFAATEQIPEQISGQGDSAQKANKPAKKRVPPQEVIARLVAAWPQAFFSEPRSVKPLTIGVLQQILANRPTELDGLNSHAIRSGIKFYTSRLSYHYGMVHNTHRITLAGEPAEEVDDKAREFAKAQIIAIKEQRAARQDANRAADNPAGGQDADDATEGKKPPRTKRFRKPRAEDGAEAKVRDENAANPVGQKPRRPRREKPPRRADNASASGTEAASPAENLSMEEKLARLAQHFGKSG